MKNIITKAELISGELQNSIDSLTRLKSNADTIQCVENIVEALVTALNNGGKILFAGNGGSAADSQHLAGEFVSRFNYDRPGLAAFALTTDTSVLTAIGNDYGYDKLFSRQIEAVANEKDVFIGLSTSGTSPNILSALQAAKLKGLTVIGFCGLHTASFELHCDHFFSAPSDLTPKIQEMHIIVGHIICGLIESSIFPRRC
jgi:D-sedoheptulose 7-phosphate isomerase